MCKTNEQVSVFYTSWWNALFLESLYSTPIIVFCRFACRNSLRKGRRWKEDELTGLVYHLYFHDFCPCDPCDELIIDWSNVHHLKAMWIFQILFVVATQNTPYPWNPQSMVEQAEAHYAKFLWSSDAYLTRGLLVDYGMCWSLAFLLTMECARPRLFIYVCCYCKLLNVLCYPFSFRCCFLEIDFLCSFYV